MTPYATIQDRIEAALPAGSLRGRFARGAFWSVAATAVSQGLGLLSYVVVARVLTQAGFGELGIVQSTVGMFGVFAGMGLGLTATKHVAEHRETDPVRAGSIIGLALRAAALTAGVCAVAFGLAAPFLAARTLDAPHLVPELRIGCVLLFLQAIDGVQAGALAGFEAFSAIARTNLFRGIANFTLVTAGVILWGLRGALCGLAGAAAVGLLVNHLALKSQMRWSGVVVRRGSLRCELPVLWKFAFPAFLSGAMVSPANWIARAFLVNVPGGYLQIAVFTAAERFQHVANTASRTMGAALLPMLASKSGRQSEILARGNILLSWIIGTAVVLPLLCYPEVVGLVFGSQYADRAATQTVVLVLLSTTIVMYTQGLARVLAAKSLMWWGAAGNFTWALALVAGAWRLVPGGATGLATAVLVAYLLDTLLLMPLFCYKRLAPIALLASPTTFVVWGVTFGLAAMSFLGFPLSLRLMALVAGMGLVSAAFVRLLGLTSLQK